MSVDASLVEISDYSGRGYKPMIDFGGWRVAYLRYSGEAPESITKMERHDETDEVFVLLEGRCLLFIGEGREALQKLHILDMQPFKLYNVKKSCWHTTILSRDARVLIVENCNTTLANSPRLVLTPEQRRQLVDLYQKSPI